MRPLAILPFVVLFSCKAELVGEPVRATLSDGQIVVGQLDTEVLQLQTGLGLVAFPLGDVGEVVPVEAEDLGSSGGKVTVWLRNGTELRGTWSEPELTVNIDIGGSAQPITVPTNDLERFQFSGGMSWPAADQWRLKTVYGDDIFIDPSETILDLHGPLGDFAPALSEIAELTRSADEWRLVLLSGTVLRVTIPDEPLLFALPLGPELIEIPPEAIAGLERVGGNLPAAPEFAAPAAVQASPSRMSFGGDWYSNEAQADWKR